jgi:hypothetical protein
MRFIGKTLKEHGVWQFRFHCPVSQCVQVDDVLISTKTKPGLASRMYRKKKKPEQWPGRLHGRSENKNPFFGEWKVFSTTGFRFPRE